MYPVPYNSLYTMTHHPFDIDRPPDFVRVICETDSAALLANRDGAWQANGIEIEFLPHAAGATVTLTAPKAAVKQLHLRWNVTLDSQPAQILGDHWERGYGDFEWRGIVPERILPWYFAAHSGGVTYCGGVRVNPASFCYWQIDAAGISLWADVRSGGVGVELGERRLDVCTIVSRRGDAAETPFQALHEFCRLIGPRDTRLPAQPIYGHNDWYYAYGKNSAAQIRDDCERIISLSPEGADRPFTVIDDGWQRGSGSTASVWAHGNSHFPDMPGLAAEIKQAGSHPGIWIRPLEAASDAPRSWRMARDKRYLDPSIPGSLEQVAADIARFNEWGYAMIKHDFSTQDITGRWGFQMGASLTEDGWMFGGGTSETTAEIIRTLYQTIREAAGDALIIGCNTIGHLSAGLFEISRTGDDTSGRDWERTRKMGINTLAFRAVQNDTFHLADPDCVGVTSAVPWALNRQWLDLVARSGQAVFLSLQPDAIGAGEAKDIRAALALAAQAKPLAEPLDWLSTSCPRHWRFIDQDRNYDWIDVDGINPNGG